MARSFYCNNCGKKVASNSRKCPSCGRYFGAVLCPRCGHSGNDKEFADGCPACGYLGDKKREDPFPPAGRKKKKRPLLDLPPLFFAVGILLLTGLLVFLIALWL